MIQQDIYALSKYKRLSRHCHNALFFNVNIKGVYKKCLFWGLGHQNHDCSSVVGERVVVNQSILVSESGHMRHFTVLSCVLEQRNASCVPTREVLHAFVVERCARKKELERKGLYCIYYRL